MKKKLIVALDFDSAESALKFLKNLDPEKCLVKVGLELFISEGWKILDLMWFKEGLVVISQHEASNGSFLHIFAATGSRPRQKDAH